MGPKFTTRMLQSGRNVMLNTDRTEAELLYISRSQKLSSHFVNYWGRKGVDSLHDILRPHHSSGHNFVIPLMSVIFEQTAMEVKSYVIIEWTGFKSF